MDPILAAYQKLQGDRSDLDGLYNSKSTADTALAKATNDQAVATNALAGGVVNFEADKTALVKLINDTLTSGPTVNGTLAAPAAS